MQRATAAILAGAVMGYTSTARAGEQALRVPTDGAVAFSYSKGADVPGCTQGDEAAVRDMLEGVMHTTPFVAKGARAPFELVVVVAKQKGGGIRAAMELRDSKGASQGTSAVEDPTCDGTHLNMAASIALLLVPPPPPPPGWDGACTSVNAIPEGALCQGVPCVRSVAVGAPVLSALPCAATTVGTESKPAAGWGTVASSCVIGALVGDCGNGDGEAEAFCAPDVPGVDTCVQRDGEHACPSDYPVQYTFHTAAADTRACSPCSCGAPEGGSCTAIALAYSDRGCQAAVGAKTVERGPRAWASTCRKGRRWGARRRR